MIKILTEKELFIRIESEIEKLLVPLLIEKGDIVEMEIVRNIFSKKEKKFLDRRQVFAKIRVEKIDFNKQRIIGKIEYVEDERVSKGFHGENIALNKEFKVLKKNELNSEIKKFLEKINKLRIEKTIELNEIIAKSEGKFITEFKKIEESIDYGLVEKLFICKNDFYNFLEKIKKALEKNSQVILVEDRYFCEKTKIAALLRFNF